MGEVSLDGRVNTPPAVSGTRFLVVTNHGDVNVFEVTATAGRKPLSSIASGKTESAQDARREQEIVRFPFLAGGRVWIAEDFDAPDPEIERLFDGEGA